MSETAREENNSPQPAKSVEEESENGTGNIDKCTVKTIQGFHARNGKHQIHTVFCMLCNRTVNI
jgi:hypothetical protein